MVADIILFFVMPTISIVIPSVILVGAAHAKYVELQNPIKKQQKDNEIEFQNVEILKTRNMIF